MLRTTCRCLVPCGVLILSILVGPAAADGMLEQTGWWPYGPSLTVALSENYLYFGNGAVLDVAYIGDPQVPFVTGSLPLPDIINGLWIEGSILYVAADDAGLRVIDISSPYRPVEIGHLALESGAAMDVEVVVDTAHVVTSHALHTVDVSTPAEPELLGRVTWVPGSGRGVAVRGAVAFVACESNGLRAIDIWNPSRPKLLSTYELPEAHAYDVAIGHGHAFVAGFWWGLRVVDVSDPFSMLEVGGGGSMGFAEAVVSNHEWAFTANLEDGIWKYGLSDLTRPIAWQVVWPTGSPTDLDLEGDLLASGNGWGGIALIDLKPYYPKVLSELDTAGRIRGIAATGDTAYLANHRDGLRVMDATDPADPQVSGLTTIDSPVTEMTLVGDLAVLTTDPGGIVTFDVGTPGNPERLGSLATPGRAYDVVVRDGLAYIADGEEGLRIFDLTDLTRPRWKGFFDTPGRVLDVAVSDGLAYLADSDGGLRIVDVSDPSEPEEIAVFDNGDRVLQVEVVGDRAYTSDHVTGLRVVDVSDPSAPVEIGRDSSVFFTGPLAVAGRCAFLGRDHFGHEFRVIDVWRETTPRLIEVVTTPGPPSDLWVDGDRLYVGQEYAGFLIYDISNCYGPPPPMGGSIRRVTPQP